MASSRFPGKPMEKLLGLPLINHIYRRCRLNEEFDQVIVATCDEVIKKSIEDDGGQAVMTSDTHERCTDRVEEAIKNLKLDLAPNDLVIMVQGDEIFVDDAMLASMMSSYSYENSPVVNVLSAMPNREDKEDINTVKAVCDLAGRILYLSREAIPSPRRMDNDLCFQQTGIIGFSYEALTKFSSLEQTPLEQIESVDMLRFIENGITVKAVKIPRETIGVDTPDDLKRSEALLAQDPLVKKYLN
jgi:3-deoxy-manno-octulosonate cytidylyltransferase (CMP-KDO synthetase)